MKLTRITLAVNHMDAMVQFYNAALGAGLVPVEGTPFYQGQLAGMTLLLCPNSIANVVAEQNRHQFKLSVSDWELVMNLALTNKGTLLDKSETGVTLVDPDGNTIEIGE